MYASSHNKLLIMSFNVEKMPFSYTNFREKKNLLNVGGGGTSPPTPSPRSVASLPRFASPPFPLLKNPCYASARCLPPCVDDPLYATAQSLDAHRAHPARSLRSLALPPSLPPVEKSWLRQCSVPPPPCVDDPLYATAQSLDAHRANPARSLRSLALPPLPSPC